MGAPDFQSDVVVEPRGAFAALLIRHAAFWTRFHRIGRGSGPGGAVLLIHEAGMAQPDVEC